MMYRQQNLVTHLKALKLLYMSGQGDLISHFASLSFMNNKECSLRESTLFFINNNWEYALKQIDQAKNPNYERYLSQGIKDEKEIETLKQFLQREKSNEEIFGNHY